MRSLWLWLATNFTIFQEGADQVMSVRHTIHAPRGGFRAVELLSLEKVRLFVRGSCKRDNEL